MLEEIVISAKKAIELADNILAKTAKEFDADWVIKNLKALREMAREEGDPAVIKILRLAYEHINDNGDFNIGFASDADEDEEADEDETEEMTSEEDDAEGDDTEDEAEEDSEEMVVEEKE